jgi:tetratricopeptide (TPR) repeat protein
LDEIVGGIPERARLREWLGALLCCGPTPDGDRSEFDAAIRSYFAAMADRATTVLVFEDLQWADGGVLDLVEQLTDWMPASPVLVLAVTRPELFQRHPGWLSARRGVVSIRLGPLAEAEMGQLLDGMLGTVEPGFRTDIIERAAGVPLYAVELARSLISQRTVATVDRQNSSLTEASSLALPETLQSLIGARIDRLDPSDRSLLQDASVLGNTFTPPGLAAVSGFGEAEITERLELFVKEELIEPIRDPRSPMRGGFRFVQDLVREVASSRMSHGVRRARHIAAAQYIESLGGPDDAVIAADHYLSALAITPAGAGEEALRTQATGALVAAFERAVSLYANDEILSLGARILDLGLDLPDDRLVTLSEQMAMAASGLMRFEEAQQHVHAAIERSRRLGDQTGVRRGVALAAYIYLESFRPRPAIEVIEEQLEGIDDFSTDPELARLGGLLARAKRVSGDLEGALAAAERALLAAEAFQLHDVVADAMITKAICFEVQGRNAEARELLESAVELTRHENLADEALTAYVALDFVVPDDQLERDPNLDAMELGRRVGKLAVVVVASMNHAEYLIKRGRWDEAAQLLVDPLLQSATGTPHTFRFLLQALAEALRGNSADAQTSMKAALAAQGDEPEELWGGVKAETAFVQALTGNTAPALAWAQEVLVDPESIPWMELLSRVLLPAGDRRQVEALAAASLDRGSTVDLRHGRFVRALVAVRAGHPASLALAEELIAGTASIGLVLDELVWTIGLARWLPEGHPDRSRLMTRAHDRINETGFEGLIRFLDS